MQYLWLIFEVTALKTSMFALDCRISYSSTTDAMRKSSINKTLLNFLLIWNYLIYIKYFNVHNRLIKNINYPITFSVLIKEKLKELFN